MLKGGISLPVCTSPLPLFLFVLCRLRCGTMTTLFAALSTLDGTLLGDCMTEHRHQEFIRFLKRIDQHTARELDLRLIG